MNILEELAGRARQRVEEAKKIHPLEEVAALAERAAKNEAENKRFAFEKALQSPGIHFICECKKASPSKGLIAPDFPYLAIAKDYEAGGADAISVLTEPTAFLGSNRYLAEIAGEVSLPLLRKDFTIDPYMIYEAKNLGASAVLLICALLSE
ncbi:MAG: indole-3-glycerol phosphate synthase TrpC, partial [Lachnospiraceae bacterium]|nr:indole-3-glycerol phosphate synthase TrpC [Lachnospiraceae bacterium]